MPVPPSIPILPHHPRRTRLAGLLALGLLFLTPYSPIPVAFAKGIDPPLRIPLENLGFQPLSAQLLLNGSSMLTLHYVDDKHLLLTFVVHRLIPRLPDEPEDDQDRLVDAFLLEIPTGKVLARTSWHLHDHSQYLWSLGHGHFLLRIRDSLTTFAPLANLATRDPFVQHPFLDSAERRYAALILSPDADLLIAETVKHTPPEPEQRPPLFGPAPPRSPKLEERDPVQISFYRIYPADDGGPVSIRFAGAVKSSHAGEIPASSAGYLAVVDQGGGSHWAFDFHSYAGKTAELAPYDSSCHPEPIFVSHSEFIAFGCRNSQTRQQIGGFNMRGEEMWEQGLFGDYVAPSLAYAPAVSRFALSRVLLRTTAVADQPISPDEVASQTVVVYQTGTGKQLLRADCSPVERAGQNFALAPNGLALAVVHADAIEIYPLPALTTKDESDIKLARSLTPPDTNLPVHFTNQPAPSSADADSSTRQPNVQPGAPAVNIAQPEPVSAASQPDQSDKSAAPASEAAKPPLDTPAPATQSGDPVPEQHRAPPTLYTLPTDKAPASTQTQNPKETPQ